MEEQEFAMNTEVQYAPRAYEWIRDCKATSDGMSIANKGREKNLSDLQDWSWEKVHSFPVSVKIRLNSSIWLHELNSITDGMAQSWQWQTSLAAFRLLRVVLKNDRSRHRQTDCHRRSGRSPQYMSSATE